MILYATGLIVVLIAAIALYALLTEHQIAVAVAEVVYRIVRWVADEPRNADFVDSIENPTQALSGDRA